jgi:hypothetical protein
MFSLKLAAILFSTSARCLTSARDHTPDSKVEWAMFTRCVQFSRAVQCSEVQVRDVVCYYVAAKSDNQNSHSTIK